MAKQPGMKRSQGGSPENEKAKEGVLYGIMVCALGSIWLAQEIGTIQSDVPIGPIVVIAVGFLMLLPWLKK
jgi:apolipoprotein N-acyltransferase